MAYENEKLGKLLSDPRIAPIAGCAIANRDLKREKAWDMTLAEIREGHVFSGDIGSGIDRLYRAAETGEWYFPVYGETSDPSKAGANLVWFPSQDPEADGRPFLLVVPGGGFVNVWNLTEGWPIASRFNGCGYHVFVLTYRVSEKERLLEKNMEDIASALRFIRASAKRFHTQGERYITCGFSAGGYLVCLWNTKLGYPAHGLAKPEAVFPVYAPASMKERIRAGRTDPASALRLYGCSLEQAALREYDIPEHAGGFPPCALFLSAGDELVDPEHSRLLAAALEKLRIPCRLEIGPTGGHGFGDGSGMCMDGWQHRALEWYESLRGGKA